MKEYGWRKTMRSRLAASAAGQDNEVGANPHSLEQLEFPAAVVGSGTSWRAAPRRAEGPAAARCATAADRGRWRGRRPGRRRAGSLRIIGSLLTVLLCGAGPSASASAATAAPESALADYVHSKGPKFGIYTSAGGFDRAVDAWSGWFLRLYHLPARRLLRIEATWSWAKAFATCWQRLTTLPAVT